MISLLKPFSIPILFLQLCLYVYLLSLCHTFMLWVCHLLLPVLLWWYFVSSIFPCPLLCSLSALFLCALCFLRSWKSIFSPLLLCIFKSLAIKLSLTFTHCIDVLKLGFGSVQPHISLNTVCYIGALLTPI